MLLSHKLTMPQHAITKQTPGKLLPNTETKQPQGQHWHGYGVWIQLRRLEMSRRVVVGEGQLSKAKEPKRIQLPTPQTSQPMALKFQIPLAKAQAALCHLDFPLQVCLFSTQKKKDQSQCIFSDPARQQRNVLIPKLGQGYLAVSAPLELCTKRRVIIAQTLSLAISLWETSLSQEPMVQCLHKGWEAVWKHDIDDF